MRIEIPEIFLPIIKPKRYKVLTGSRGSAKSESVARHLLIKGTQQTCRILCTREYQSNIHESVHRTLRDLINQYNLKYYEILKYNIRNLLNGTEFIFEGMQNMNGIKSIKGITDVWCEESHTVSQNSLDILLPTIREPNSEIIFTLNQETEDDPVIVTFCNEERCNPETGDVLHIHSTYKDNPFFPDVLVKEMEWCKRTDYDKYLHIWEGNPKKQSDALIFKNKFKVVPFETPDLAEVYQNRFFFGADWGFANDPCVLNRMFIKDNCLWIDYEAWGIGVELDDIPALFDTVPDSRIWNIKGDCSRPETVSHISHKGFNIDSAPKWAGSIEDGVSYLKSFDTIYIHPRCIHTIDDYSYYSYKVDKHTGEILPVILDANNHSPDACRYALSDYIKKEVSIYDSY
jgi:phage terminase large subunit